MMETLTGGALVSAVLGYFMWKIRAIEQESQEDRKELHELRVETAVTDSKVTDLKEDIRRMEDKIDRIIEKI